jgi:hypothetical protein
MVSLRTARWRYTVLMEGTNRPANPAIREQLGLFDVRGPGRWWQRDVSSQNPGVVESLDEVLSVKLGEWKGNG